MKTTKFYSRLKHTSNTADVIIQWENKRMCSIYQLKCCFYKLHDQADENYVVKRLVSFINDHSIYFSPFPRRSTLDDPDTNYGPQAQILNPWVPFPRSLASKPCIRLIFYATASQFVRLSKALNQQHQQQQRKASTNAAKKLSKLLLIFRDAPPRQIIVIMRPGLRPQISRVSLGASYPRDRVFVSLSSFRAAHGPPQILR